MSRRNQNKIEIQAKLPWQNEWVGFGMYYPAEDRRNFTRRDMKWIKKELKWYKQVTPYEEYRLVKIKYRKVV